MKGTRRSANVKITLMVGAEAWVEVRHATGAFRCPADTTVQEILRGALEGWVRAPKQLRRGEAMVRVPLAEWAYLWGKRG